MKKLQCSSDIKKMAEKIKYRGRIYYLKDCTIYDARMNVFIPDATNGFLDLYEYFEYFESNQQKKEKNYDETRAN